MTFRARSSPSTAGSPRNNRRHGLPALVVCSLQTRMSAFCHPCVNGASQL
uniref:Uncharacterized protein n=1 Tax=uncultured marine virus TaxID=186617 RepID=A0A0F7L294_9VIRU|nr:hypothetical protein [uncultured marine virus]